VRELRVKPIVWDMVLIGRSAEYSALFRDGPHFSNTGPNEGTLRVYPFLREMTAYALLRPLFR